ncbi:MAG: hypothetical protein JKY70_15390 [Mucilaginibacter sp.]|nr:hypothetical protein [Mucilaginibacter sp.]
MIAEFENYTNPDEDDWFGPGNGDDDTNYEDPSQGDMSVPDLDEPFKLPKEVLNDNEEEGADS